MFYKWYECKWHIVLFQYASLIVYKAINNKLALTKTVDTLSAHPFS